MSEQERKARERVMALIRRRTLIPIKRYDPFLTQLRVAMLKCKLHVVCGLWDW